MILSFRDTKLNGKNLLLSIYLGIVFFIWENLFNSWWGSYHFELRRTFWGIIYYALLFLLFWCFGLILGFVYRKLFRGRYWNGQNLLFFLAILFMFLGGIWINELAAVSYGLKHVLLAIFWVSFLAVISLLLNHRLAKYYSSDSPNKHQFVQITFFTLFLYLLITGKIYLQFFHFDRFNAVNVILQPLILALSFGFIWFVFRLIRSFRGRLLSFAGIPLAATILIVLSQGLLSPADRGTLSVNDNDNPSPNIIVMLFDSLREDYIGFNAEGSTLTPTMDSLVTSNSYYSDYYATSSWTFPSISAMMTSRLQNKLGLDHVGDLPEDVPLLAEILSDNGYSTAGISSNDFFDPRHGFDRGFDSFYTISPAAQSYLLLPFKSFFPHMQLFSELAYQFDFVSGSDYRRDWRDINTAADSCLNSAGDKPLFMHMHYMNTHWPFWSMPMEGLGLDGERLFLALYNSYKTTEEQDSAESHKRLRARFARSEEMLYRNGVRTADLAVKDVIEKLRHHGMDNNTVLIITSDHGDEFLEHDEMFHGNNLFNSTVQIPLLIVIPDQLKHTMPDLSGPLTALDFAPTILDFAGVNLEDYELEGRSLLRVPVSGNRAVYMFLGAQQSGLIWSGIIQDSYKHIQALRIMDGQVQNYLFDLNEDGHETNNLYDANQEIADSLAALLKIQADQTIRKFDPGKEELDGKVLERLRALGYVH